MSTDPRSPAVKAAAGLLFPCAVEERAAVARMLEKEAEIASEAGDQSLEYRLAALAAAVHGGDGGEVQRYLALFPAAAFAVPSPSEPAEVVASIAEWLAKLTSDPARPKRKHVGVLCNALASAISAYDAPLMQPAKACRDYLSWAATTLDERDDEPGLTLAVQDLRYAHAAAEDWREAEREARALARQAVDTAEARTRDARTPREGAAAVAPLAVVVLGGLLGPTLVELIRRALR